MKKYIKFFPDEALLIFLKRTCLLFGRDSPGKKNHSIIHLHFLQNTFHPEHLKLGRAYGLVRIPEPQIVAASLGFLVAFELAMVLSTFQILTEGVTGIVLRNSLVIVPGTAKPSLMVAICKAATSKTLLSPVPLSGLGCLFVV